MRRLLAALLIISVTGCTAVPTVEHSPIPTEFSPTATPTEASPTATATKEPTVTPTQKPEIPTPTPEFIRAGYKEEHSAEVLGFQVHLTLELDRSVMERQTRPISRVYLNTQDFPDAEQRVAEAIMRGHWHAWQADNPGERSGVSFEDFVARLRNGEDMTYYVAAIPSGASSVIPQEHVPINPAAPAEVSWVWETGPLAGLGWFWQTSRGGIRIEIHDSHLSPSAGVLNDIRASYPGVSDEEVIRSALSSQPTRLMDILFGALSWEEVYQLGEDPPLPLKRFDDITGLLRSSRGEPPIYPVILEKNL